MSDIGAMVAELIAAGCAPEVAAKVVASAFVAGVSSANSTGIPVDKAAEKRRAWDRARKRNSTGIPPDSTGIPISPLSIDKDKKKERGRGTRLPPEWKPDEEDRAFARTLGWSESQIDAEAANYRDYWIAKPGSGGVKLDWPATWRKWARSSRVKPANQPAATNGTGAMLDPEDAVKHFAKTGRWSRWAGPEPGMAGCRASDELLALHGFLPDGRKIQGASP